MVRTSSVSWLCALIALGTPVVAGSGEGLFRDVTLDQAKKAATDGGKRLVVVDFYTVWCGPCKKLDETTWKDQGVRDWASKEAVCIKVDAEKDEKLAETYRINVYPTVLLLRPDGTEVDRLVGYRDAKTFLADAREALAGNDSLARARKKLEGAGATDPMLRMDYGGVLVEKGRLDDGLSEYLWCFDHGLEHGPAFVGVRLSFLLSRIIQLGRTHPAALDELRKRRDAAGKAIEARNADFNTTMGFTALNTSLGEPKHTLVVYDRIKDDKAQPDMIRRYIFEQAIDQLLAAKRYKEVITNTDAKARIRELIARYERIKGMLPKDDLNVHTFMKRQVSVEGAKYYEALLGSGEPAQAGEIVMLLAKFDAAEAFPPLIAAAKRAGDTKAAEALEDARKTAKPRAVPETTKTENQ
jgi:thiol-disulfide isomerase/thioredoxin